MYNGSPTDDHVVFNGQDIDFYGYFMYPYYDYVFSDKYHPNGIAFTLSPKNMNFHSLRQTGCLFNGVLSFLADNITRYTGFALILESANPLGVMENTPNAPNTFSLSMYYLNNEAWDTEHGGSFWYSDVQSSLVTRKPIALIKGVIRGSDAPFRVSVETGTDPTGTAFKVYVDGSLVADLSSEEANNHIDGNAPGFGFGFFTAYYEHSCKILTRVAYELASFDIFNSQDKVKAVARFVDKDNQNSDIRDSETEMGWVGQPYRVSQPKTIDNNGTIWFLVGNDINGDIDSDIRRTYEPNEADNTTKLLYAQQGTGAWDPSPPALKTARVNGGEWATGSAHSPIEVVSGDEIDYFVTVYGKPAEPMLTIGNGNQPDDTTWFNQPPAVRSGLNPAGIVAAKISITDITFVSLPENYASPDEFLAAQPVWGGKAILKVWDATETDAANLQPYSKVYVWLTNDKTDKYHAFIGGKGGVWMSARNADTYQFTNFSNVAQFAEMEAFHTDNAVNMALMYRGCYNLTSLNLTRFNTSKVEKMAYMFYVCSKLTDLNLISFDTSNVIDMTGMFGFCENLSALDLHSFNTSNVISIESIFYYCKAIQSLDVSNLDTSKVKDMTSAFGWCQKLETLNLSSWNTTEVDKVSAIFYDCAALTEIHMESAEFTTDRPVVNTHAVNAFYGHAAGLKVYVGNETTANSVKNWGGASVGVDMEVLVELPMLTIGNDAPSDDTTWFNQPPDVRSGLNREGIVAAKTSITHITFVSLPENYASPVDFLAAQSDGLWGGKEILKAWDATETDPANLNPNSKVYVWLTSDEADDTYHAFIGGKGGVWMSARNAPTYQFRSFDSVAQFAGMEAFHTNNAVNMAYMYYDCNKLVSLDLIRFNTSNAENMYSIFYHCDKLLKLDLSSFNTSKVIDMQSMFGYCGNLSELDLHNFNTSNVTSTDSMFLGCYRIQSLDVSNFDTSNVITMNSMFYKCEKLKNLNLSSWNTGKVDNVGSIFYNCAALTEIHMESAEFTMDRPRISTHAVVRAFYNHADGLKVYVGDDETAESVRRWGNADDENNPVTVLIKPLPPDQPPADQMTLTDTIPNGMTIQSCSANPDGSAPTVVGQTITWDYTSDDLPRVFTVKVRALNAGQAAYQSALGDAKGYINFATVANTTKGALEDTNSTYHKAVEGYLVTEKYYIWDGQSDGIPNLPNDQKLDDDLRSALGNMADTYSVKNMRDSLNGADYLGYMRVGIDTDIQPGNPPDPAYFDEPGGHNPNIATNLSETLVLFYKTTSVDITIHFANVDPPYNDIPNPNFDGETSVSVSAPRGVAYWLFTRYMNGFINTDKPWAFVDYKDSYSQGTPPDTTRDNRQHYPLGDPKHPMFTASQMESNQHITLYYKQHETVFVSYAEWSLKTHILHNPETFFSDTDLATQGRDGGTAYFSDNIAAAGKTYTYVDYYEPNGIQRSDLPEVDTGDTITLYFSTNYKITEMFHGIEPGQNNHEVYHVTPLVTPDGSMSVDVPGGDVFNRMDAYNNLPEPDWTEPPATIEQSGVTWYYLGWRVGCNDEEPLRKGLPPEELIPAVWRDEAFIYVYDKGLPVKTARVSDDDGVTWNGYVTGTQSHPVKIKVGSRVEYTILPRPSDVAVQNRQTSAQANLDIDRIGAIPLDEPPVTTTVSDLLPPNMKYVSSNTPDGVAADVTTAEGNRTLVTWSSVEFQPGMEFTVVARADAYSTKYENYASVARADAYSTEYENYASVAPQDYSTKPTNYTWHLSKPPSPLQMRKWCKEAARRRKRAIANGVKPNIRRYRPR
ncbi:MAG: DUF285 domain-containing protein [Oscillospiraceae bacterium]|nr:DUF285 domain-containing protein [Oscillospiraceae bacterium]